MAREAEDEKSAAQKNNARGFSIFRASDAPLLEDVHPMKYAGITPIIQAGMTRLLDAGVEDGSELRVLVEVPGFSLTHVWFKSAFPLPRHSHEADCLYYVVGGTLRLGTETLHAGDGFFVPANAPYTYTPGADGVELLEIRHGSCSDIKVLAGSAIFWEKAANIASANRGKWQSEERPSLI